MIKGTSPEFYPCISWWWYKITTHDTALFGLNMNDSCKYITSATPPSHAFACAWIVLR